MRKKTIFNANRMSFVKSLALNEAFSSKFRENRSLSWMLSQLLNSSKKYSNFKIYQQFSQWEIHKSRPINMSKIYSNAEAWLMPHQFGDGVAAGRAAIGGPGADFPSQFWFQNFEKSNQNTAFFQRPITHPLQWIQKGDLLGDCTASTKGELALGRNLLVAYMPWEGFNFEDAVLINQKVLSKYTSLHIEKYDFEITGQITRNIPEIPPQDLQNLDKNGIIKIGSWVQEGDILVGKIIPILSPNQTLLTHEKLLYDIVGQKSAKSQEKCLRANVSGRVIRISYFTSEKNRQNINENSLLSFPRSGNLVGWKAARRSPSGTRGEPGGISQPEGPRRGPWQRSVGREEEFEKLSLNEISNNAFMIKFQSYKFLLSLKFLKSSYAYGCIQFRFLTSTVKKEMSFVELSFPHHLQKKTDLNIGRIVFRWIWLLRKSQVLFKKLQRLQQFRYRLLRIFKGCHEGSLPFFIHFFKIRSGQGNEISIFTKRFKNFLSIDKRNLLRKTDPLNNRCIDSLKHIPQKVTQTKLINNGGRRPSTNSLKKMAIYIANKREFQVGDKISGRHGNKGIISQIFSNYDMPYLSNGSTLDVLLNPLGVPSRMNVGQILECLLGFAGQIFHTKFQVLCFDEMYGYEASRSFIYSKLFESCKKTRQKWLFSKKTPGKLHLFDGRNGQLFHQSIIVGSTYLMKLIHIVDEKIHARATGPYSLITQQPLRGRAKHGGQRVGEMEVWALQGFGSAYTLQELLTVKSDDLQGRNQILQTLLKNTPLRFGTSESLRVVLRELQCLCLDLQIY